MNVAADHITQLFTQLDSHTQIDLKAQWQQLEREHRERERLWRREEIDHRRDQIEWRRVDDKRRRVDEKMVHPPPTSMPHSEGVGSQPVFHAPSPFGRPPSLTVLRSTLTQVALLARLSALMGGFQVAMYINQGLPSKEEVWPANQQGNETADGEEGGSVWSSLLLNEWLLTLWAVVSGTVIVLNFSVMVVASLIQLTVAHKTGQEDPTGTIGWYGFHNPEGVIRHSSHFLEYWAVAHDSKFRRMMHVFSCGVPVYFFSLGLAAAIKFYMSVAAALTCIALSLAFIAGWFFYLMPHMNLLLNRSSSSEYDDDNYDAETVVSAAATVLTLGRTEHPPTLHDPEPPTPPSAAHSTRPGPRGSNAVSGENGREDESEGWERGESGGSVVAAREEEEEEEAGAKEEEERGEGGMEDVEIRGVGVSGWAHGGLRSRRRGSGEVGGGASAGKERGEDEGASEEDARRREGAMC